MIEPDIKKKVMDRVIQEHNFEMKAKQRLHITHQLTFIWQILFVIIAVNSIV